MKDLSERSRKEHIWEAYEHLKKEADRHQKVVEGLSDEFSSLKDEHSRLQEKTDFIDGLRRRLADMNERMDLLTKVSQELNSLELNRTLDLCISKIPFLINAKFTSIYLFDESKGMLVLRKSNHGREIRQEIPIAETRTLMALALERKEILLIRDLEEFRKTSGRDFRLPFADLYGTGSCIVAPLLVGDQLVGVITFADRNDERPFSETSDLQPMRALVGILAASIRNVQLFEQVKRQSSHDGLTGLLNHSSFIQTLDREVQRAQRYKEPLSLVLADVDRFRSHNANLGHDGGDAILLMVGRVLGETLRTVDLAGRYGADEFAVILPQTAIEGARNVADRVLEGIRKQAFTYRGRTYSITASAGVVPLAPSLDHTGMLSLAEEAIQKQHLAGKEGEVATVTPPPAGK